MVNGILIATLVHVLALTFPYLVSGQLNFDSAGHNLPCANNDDTQLLLEKLSEFMQMTAAHSAATKLELATLVKTLNETQEALLRLGCPDGFVSFQRSCYKLVGANVDWHNANNSCRDQSAYLVEINSEAEQQFLEQKIDGMMAENVDAFYRIDYSVFWSNGVFFWLGGHSAVQDGQWDWTSGRKLQSGYQNWNTNEPNGDYNDNCLHFGTMWKFKWDDVRCHGLTHNYICEMEL